MRISVTPLSNYCCIVGMYGITAFSAVINPPQACILAVGAGIQRVLPPLPGPDQSRPRVVTTVTVQLSADRRVVDEATAAQFLQVGKVLYRIHQIICATNILMGNFSFYLCRCFKVI